MYHWILEHGKARSTGESDSWQGVVQSVTGIMESEPGFMHSDRRVLLDKLRDPIRSPIPTGVGGRGWELRLFYEGDAW